MAAAKRKLSSCPRNRRIPAMTPLMICIVASFPMKWETISIFILLCPGLPNDLTQAGLKFRRKFRRHTPQCNGRQRTLRPLQDLLEKEGGLIRRSVKKRDDQFLQVVL